MTAVFVNHIYYLQGELKLIPDFHVATWNRWLQSSRFAADLLFHVMPWIFISVISGIGVFRVNSGGDIGFRPTSSLLRYGHISILPCFSFGYLSLLFRTAKRPRAHPRTTNIGWAPGPKKRRERRLLGNLVSTRSLLNWNGVFFNIHPFSSAFFLLPRITF